MKFIVVIVVSLLVTIPVLSQVETEPVKDLRLSTKTVAQQFCNSGYQDMAQLRLKLNLIYSNQSQRPAILYKGSNLIHYILISANQQKAETRDYEANIHVGWISSRVKLNETAKPGKEFVVLAPGQSYQTEAEVTFPIDLDSSTQYLKAGQHVFQGQTETWPGDEVQFERLKRKWAGLGVLWNMTARSEPMPFYVEPKPKLVECH